MAAQSVRASGGAHAHARRSTGLVPRERRRIPPQLSDALLGQEPLEGDDLFIPAEDDWAFESLLAQVSWAQTLWAEGGLFVVIGQKEPGAPSAAAGS